MAAAREAEVPIHLKVGVNPNAFFPQECYQRTVEYMDRHREQAGVTLIHGTIASAGGIRVGHAWVELPEGIVFESVCQRFYHQEDYYTVRGAQAVAQYTWPEMDAFLKETDQYGPWHPGNTSELEERLARRLAASLGARMDRLT